MSRIGGNLNLIIDIDGLRKIAAKIRWKILNLAHRANVAHLGSSLSTVEILTLLYFEILKINPKNPKDENRDRFILSKGHAAMALYSILSEKGFFTEKELETFGKNGTILAEHPDRNIPGVETATGSLGHGFGVGIGMALAAKIKNQDYRVYVLVSDGECNEGSVWEGAMFAPMRQLDNLTVMVDFNKWQATDRSTKVLALEPLTDKWKSFGWEVFEADGHDFAKLKTMLEAASKVKNKPSVIVCHTTKGKGISFMEDNNNWHYRVPNEEEMAISKVELGIK